MPDDNSYRSDIAEAMGAGPAPDAVDEAIRILSSAARLRKKEAEIKGDKAMMAAVSARIAELTGGRKGRAEDGE